jgi:hypothetical protein
MTMASRGTTMERTFMTPIVFEFFCYRAAVGGDKVCKGKAGERGGKLKLSFSLSSTAVG